MNAFHNTARHPSRPRRPVGRIAEAGSILVNTAVAMSLIVIALIGTELGYLFYMKREFQKTVDLAALAGAQYLPVKAPSNCIAESKAANDNAAANLPGIPLTSVKCGEWSKAAPATILATGNSNAVRVAIDTAPPSVIGFFTGNRRISVEAIAIRDEPMAVFSVGSNLANTNPEGVLIHTLGLVGLKPDLDLVTFRGLAGVNIKPAGLLHALGVDVSTDIGVGELNTLLAGRQIQLSQLLDVIVTLAGQQGVAQLELFLTKLKLVGLDAKTVFVQLGTAGGTPSTSRGLFALIQAPTTASALGVDVDALSLFNAALGVGTKTHAATLDLGLTGLTTLTGVTADAKLRVIEPPSIGIGNIGTTAYNAQVRLYVYISTTAGGLVSTLLNLLGTSINLPIMIDVASAYGTLKGMDCTASPNTARFDVQSTILNACIGNPAIGVANPTPAQFETAVFSTSKICEAGLQPMSLVKLLGINLLYGKAYVPALTQLDPVTVPVGGYVDTDPNNLAIGTTIAKLVSQLLNLVLAQPGSTVTIAPLPTDVATTTATDYLARAGLLPNGRYNVDSIYNMLKKDDLTWGRPCGLLELGTCPMPDRWKGETTQPIAGCAGLGVSNATYNNCVKSNLVTELQTTDGGGLLGTLLGAVGNLLGTLLGTNDSTKPGVAKPSLLAGILAPIIELLRPVLDQLGKLISQTILSDIAGLDIGRSRVALDSLSCKNTKLVR